ncbi:MAG: hypothetical protein E7264_11145 [Lachnospiraceae bacterium]|nr:hypothetical protein [Lachnospiraceae bacterium]
MKNKCMFAENVSYLCSDILIYVMLFVTVLSVCQKDFPSLYYFSCIPIILFVCQLIREYCHNPVWYVLSHVFIWGCVLMIPFEYIEYRYLCLVLLFFETINGIRTWKMKLSGQREEITWLLPVCACALYFLACKYMADDYQLIIYYMGIGVLLLHFVRIFVAGLIKLATNSVQATSIPMKKIIGSSILILLLFSVLLVVLSVWALYSNVDVFFSAIGEVIINFISLLIRAVGYIVVLSSVLGSPYSFEKEMTEAEEKLEEAVTEIQDPSIFLKIIQGCCMLVVMFLVIYAVYVILISLIRIFSKRYVKDTDVVKESKKVDETISIEKKKESMLKQLKSLLKNDNASKIRRAYRSKIDSYKPFVVKKYDTTDDIAKHIYCTYDEDLEVLTHVYQKARYSNEEITIEDVKMGLSSKY